MERSPASARRLRLELTRALSGDPPATTDRILAQSFWALPVASDAKVVALVPRLADSGLPNA
ncbi:MAG: hypothetical protein IPM79_02730 [Polyangiaceae bacterium]|nr:hypothetical protein [Polyangiaceae bacterium]MBK8936578.1 hypothetical protein [Polyangiaceae bacterium]